MRSQMVSNRLEFGRVHDGVHLWRQVGNFTEEVQNALVQTGICFLRFKELQAASGIVARLPGVLNAELVRFLLILRLVAVHYSFHDSAESLHSVSDAVVSARVYTAAE